MKKYINEQGWGGDWNPGDGSGNNNGWNQGGGNNNGWNQGGGNNNGWNQGGGNTTGFPEWAKCLEPSGAKKKNDNVVFIVNSKGNTLYFSKSGKFQYTFTSKPGTANQMGNWRCNGTNGYLINMDNGDRWDGTKWVEGSQNNGGGNTSQGWEPDPTGNQTWEYQVRDCKWIARKKGQTREYNISDNPKYKSSVDTLNQKLPNLIKNCNKTKPEETKSTSTGVEVPTATVPSQGSSTITKPGQTQDGLTSQDIVSASVDDFDKVLLGMQTSSNKEGKTQNSTKPQPPPFDASLEGYKTNQRESVVVDVNTIKEDFYNTLKKIL